MQFPIIGGSVAGLVMSAPIVPPRAAVPSRVDRAGPLCRPAPGWVGNEAGVARTSERSVVAGAVEPATTHGEEILLGGAQAADLGSRYVLADRRCDSCSGFPLKRTRRFGPAGSITRPSRQSRRVGRDAVPLLNVPPGTHGRISDADVASMTAFGAAIQDTYDTSLLSGGARDRKDAVFRSLTDDRFDTAWQPPGNALAGAVRLDLAAGVTFDQVRLGEDATRGQQVEQFVADAWDGAAWTRPPRGSTIGDSRLLVLDPPVTTDGVRVQIPAARATPRLTFVGAYRRPETVR